MLIKYFPAPEEYIVYGLGDHPTIGDLRQIYINIGYKLEDNNLMWQGVEITDPSMFLEELPNWEEHQWDPFRIPKPKYS